MDLYHVALNLWFFNAKRKKLDTKYNPINLMLETYDYKEMIKKEDQADKNEEFADLPLTQTLKNDEVKEETRIKILISNKLLTSLPVFVEQMKVGNNSCKLKSEIRRILYLLYKHNKIKKKLYNILIKLL